MSQVAIIEMVPPVLRRALEPLWPPFARWMPFHLRPSSSSTLQLASYNERLLGAAHLLCIPEWDSSGREQTRGPRTVNA
jgi:hypothetical protein